MVSNGHEDYFIIHFLFVLISKPLETQNSNARCKYVILLKKGNEIIAFLLFLS